MPPVPLARVIRSGLEESVHPGDVVVVDSDGAIVACAGEPDRQVFARSCMKPLQATVSLSLAPFNFTAREIAVMCASHNAEPVHVATVRSLLARAGVPEDALRCPACGSTLRDFRDSGRLGCDRCYVSFDTHLRDLLRRLHGSSQHVGERYESPGSAGGGDDPRSRLLELRAQLRRAVEGENFELAAELRDRIRVLE